MYVCVDVYMIPRKFFKENRKDGRTPLKKKKKSLVGWINTAQATSDQPSRVNDDRLHMFSFTIQELCLMLHLSSLLTSNFCFQDSSRRVAKKITK